MTIKELFTPVVLQLINESDIRGYIISMDVALQSNTIGYIIYDVEKKEYLIDLGDEDADVLRADPIVIAEESVIEVNGDKGNSFSVVESIDGDKLILSFYKDSPYVLIKESKE